MSFFKRLMGLDKVFHKAPLIVYCACWALITICCVMVLAIFSDFVIGQSDSNHVKASNYWGYYKVFLGVVVAPIVETLVLLFIFVATYEFTGKRVFSALVAAAMLSSLHGIYAIQWGVSVFPFFLISSLLYAIHRGKSFIKTKIMLIHSFHNFYVFVVAYFAGLMFV